MHLNILTIMTQRITKYVSTQIHNTIKLCFAAPFGKIQNDFLGEQNNVFEMYYIENEKMILWLLEHPRSVCLNYNEHFLFSMNLARQFFIASFKAVVHAFVPCWYITSSSDMVRNVQEEMKEVGCGNEKDKKNE